MIGINTYRNIKISAYIYRYRYRQSIDVKTSISSKASMISQWEWLGKGKHNISSEIARYKNVTRADIMRVFNKYIKNRKAVINQVRPKSPFVKELDSFAFTILF